MGEICTYGSVGGAPGNRCFYPAVVLYNPTMWEKADALHAAEGSSPGCVVASAQDTTGV